MDWLFRPLGDFFVWTFGIIESLGMNFNRFMLVVGSILIIYWIVRMFKDRKDTKGLFRKQA